jgi:hypothetical protein
MLYGANTGVLCLVQPLAAGSYPVSSTANLMEGMVVDIYPNMGAVPAAAGVRISYVNRKGNTVKFETAPPALGANGYMYVQGSIDKELTGLAAIFDAPILYGISRTAYPFLKPVTTAVNGSIDDIVIQRAIDALENDANSTVDFIACSADVKYAYQEYLSQYKRNVDILELEGGFKSLSFNGLPLVYERFVDSGVMYLLNTKAFKLHQLCDWRFLETENGRILRQNQGRATYSATLVKYCDLICDRPNGQARLTGISNA